MESAVSVLWPAGVLSMSTETWWPVASAEAMHC